VEKPAGAQRGARHDEVNDEVDNVVQTAVETVSRAGTVSLAAFTDALESVGRSLTRRVVEGAVADPPSPAGAAGGTADAGRAPASTALIDRGRLAESLAAGPKAPALGSATVAAIGLKVATRFRKLGFLAKRTPAFLVAAAVPALVASVTRGAHELGMVASHLAQRARAEGVEPDLDRVRRVAVQIMARRPIDPEIEPSHGALARSWLWRAARAALPFTSGVITSDPRGIAAKAAEVDVRELGQA
jgi:hypothetical protein